MTKKLPETTQNLKLKLILLSNVTQLNINEFNCDSSLNVIKQCYLWGKWNVVEEWKIVIAHMLKRVCATTNITNELLFFETLYKHHILIGDQGACHCGFAWEHTEIHPANIDSHYFCVARLGKGLSFDLGFSGAQDINFLFLLLVRQDLINTINHQLRWWS